jgi:hypothetical protein
MNTEKLNSEITKAKASLDAVFDRALSFFEEPGGEKRINSMMDGLMSELENSCVAMRSAVERCRPLIPIDKDGGKPYHIPDLAGSIEVTPEGWTHIRLNALLPHCRYKTTGYLKDTLTRLIDAYGHAVPKYESAFLAIVEHCCHANRNAFDNDNKGWKQIPNALKGRLFADDDQFHLSIGLFAKLSVETACHIYVLPVYELPYFADYLL